MSGEFTQRLLDAETEICDGLASIQGPAAPYVEWLIPGEELLQGIQPIHRAEYIVAKCRASDAETAIRGMIRQAQLARENWPPGILPNARPDDIVVWRTRPEITDSGEHSTEAYCRLAWIPAGADLGQPAREAA